MKTRLFFLLFIFLASSLSAKAGCTNILVSKGASSDGSVMITYSADLGGLLGRLYFAEAADHASGDPVETFCWTKGIMVRHAIPQAAHTYRVLGLMNEHQLAIGETSTGGRRELYDKEGLLDYEALMILALQRAKTAREAIRVMDELITAYGYRSGGESFSIADKNEVWLMEMIGKGPGVKGAVWVAARVPEGRITCHANMSRITTFPLDDPDNWLYAPDVIDFAVEKGYFRPEEGIPFSFRDAYFKITPRNLRLCATRVWSVYRRSAPSQHFSDDYHRGVEGAEDYPLFIKPDQRLSVRHVMELMRDHYEGTPYDMTCGIDAGPFTCPYRIRGLLWKVDGETYCWERPIATQQAGFVMVTQSRSWLPDAVGGIYWYTPDDCYLSCFAPFYCGIGKVPHAFTRGDIKRFSPDSAWWVYNLVANLTYARYARILPEILKKRKEMEDSFFAMQPSVEKTAVHLAKRDQALMRQFLTTYSVSTAEGLVDQWEELGAFLLTKHNDGFVLDPDKGTQELGYPEEWLRRVLKDRPQQFKLPK